MILSLTCMYVSTYMYTDLLYISIALKYLKPKDWVKQCTCIYRCKDEIREMTREKV